MTIVLYVVAAVFGAKLMWNLILPIELERRIRRGQAKRGTGVSMMIGVELALLLIVVAVSAVTSGGGWIHRPGWVAVIGVGAIVASYVLMYLVAVAQVGVMRVVKRGRS